MRLSPSVRAFIRACAVALAFSAGGTAAHAQITRFFLLPDNDLMSGSDSMLTGTHGSVGFAFDFAEHVRFNRGGYVTLELDSQNPLQWNVRDFDFASTDLGLGAQLRIQRPAGPGPHGTWTVDTPGWFVDGAGVTVAMTVEVVATAPLDGAFPASQTLALTGTIVPGLNHNHIMLTGALDGIPGAPLMLHMKRDFYPPAIAWQMVVVPGASSALVAGDVAPSGMQGGFAIERDGLNPSVYTIHDLGIEVLSTPPVILSMPPGPNAGTLTFDSTQRGLIGWIDVLVDGVPGTLQVDGLSDGFIGAALRPTHLSIEDAAGVGTLSLVQLELAPVEIVLPEGAVWDFNLGETTTLLFRGRGGDLYGYAASFASLPGINTGVGDIPIMVDDLLFLSTDPTNPFFFDTWGTIPASGEQFVHITLPAIPEVAGLNIFLGGATLDPVTFVPLAVTNSHRATLR